MKQMEFSIPLGRQRGEEGGSRAALAAHRSWASNGSSKELLQLLGSFSSPPIVRVKIQWLEKLSCSATKVNAATPCRFPSAAPERLLEISQELPGSSLPSVLLRGTKALCAPSFLINDILNDIIDDILNRSDMEGLLLQSGPCDGARA